MALQDQPVNFAEGTIDGATLTGLANAQDGARITGFGGENGPIELALDPGAPVDLSAINLGGSIVALDGSAVTIAVAGQPAIGLTGLGGEPITFADGTISGADLQTLGRIQAAEGGTEITYLDPLGGGSVVELAPDSTADLGETALSGKQLVADGDAVKIVGEGSDITLSGLADQQVAFADAGLTAGQLQILANLQEGGAAVTEAGEGGIAVALAPDEPVDLAQASLSNQDASLGDMNQVSFDADGQTLKLAGLSGQEVQLAEGALSGGEFVALLASRRGGTAAADLERDLADGSADYAVMAGVPVDLSAFSYEDSQVTREGDGLIVTLSDGSELTITGLGNEPVVFADTIIRGELLLAQAGDAGPEAVETGDAAPAAVALSEGTGAIVVNVEPGRTVDLTDYQIGGSAVVLDGETVVVTLADGRELRIVGLEGEEVRFADARLPGNEFVALVGDTDVSLIEPAAGPEAGPAPEAPTVPEGPGQPGGGTVVDAAEQGPLGQPIPLAALLDPTALAFAGIDPRPGEGDDGVAEASPPVGPPGDDGAPEPISYNAQLAVADQPVAPLSGFGASTVVPIDIGDDGPLPGSDPAAPRDSADIGGELAGVDTVDGRILDGLLIVDLPDYGALLYDFDDGAGLTPITADMILGGPDETVFPIAGAGDFVYQAYGNYGKGAATWQQAIDDGLVSAITGNAIGGADEFVLAEVATLQGPGNLDNNTRIGVTGNTTFQQSVDQQIGHDSRAGVGSEINVSTEALRIDFAVDIGAMQFEAIRLFADEHLGGNEVGRWTAFRVDADGNATQVATQTFTGTDPRIPGKLEGDLIVNVDAGAPFNRIEFTTLAYSNAPGVPEPTGPNNYESSDYSLANIKVTPADGDQFQYLTFVDTDANEAYDPGVDVASAPATVYLDTEIV